MRRLFIVAACLALLTAPVAGQDPAADRRRPKKLIATGWDQADTKRLRENLAVMERRPFDGVVLGAVGRIDDKRTCPLRWAFVDRKWQRSWFERPLADLKACKPARFTDNFVSLGANPGSVDWFDDAGWSNIVEHWRITAWLARQGGLKGILFDPEPYTPPHAQFNYTAQPRRDKHSFNEYFAQARRRGREVMRAVVEEYPDITLFCYFMNSVNAASTGRADPRRMLAARGYGLYPAFIDGWLDVAPPTVTFVDGCESAYRYSSAREYLEAHAAIKGRCQELVWPANRAKYRAQVQVSFGIYLDAYWNPPTSPWYVDPRGGTRVARLRENVRTALRLADEYVWVYGEKFRWWPTPNTRVSVKSWPEALMGSESALAFARDPVGTARSQLAGKAKPPNVARNGDFTLAPAGPGRPPAHWHAWQQRSSKGTFTWDGETGRSPKGSARAAGVADGCFLQSMDVKPGETYAVSAVTRRVGKGRTWVRVRWQTAAGRWTAETSDKLLLPDEADGGWREIFGVADVPPGVGKLVVLLSIAGQTEPKDSAWFDDVQVCRIE